MRRDSSTIAIKYITTVPKSKSPFNDDVNNNVNNDGNEKNKLVILKQILGSENISKDFVNQVRK